MRRCRCSARKPTEKGFACRVKPAPSSISNVSRAECPGASSSAPQGSSPCGVHTAASRPVPHAQAGERRVEKHLPAQRLDLPPDRHNNIPQRIGADVRLLLVGNIPGRAMRQQRPGDKSTTAGR